MSDARNILGLDNNKEVNISLVSKEDGMAYIRSLNRVTNKQDILLESDSLEYQLNSIMIANEAVTNDMILESERLQLVKELMISENGISLESATDIMDSYISEGAKWDKFINAVINTINKFITMIKKGLSFIYKLIFRVKSLREVKEKLIQHYSQNKNLRIEQVDKGVGVRNYGLYVNPSIRDFTEEIMNKFSVYFKNHMEQIMVGNLEAMDSVISGDSEMFRMYTDMNKLLYNKFSNSMTIYEFVTANECLFDTQECRNVVTVLSESIREIENRKVTIINEIKNRTSEDNPVIQKLITSVEKIFTYWLGGLNLLMQYIKSDMMTIIVIGSNFYKSGTLQEMKDISEESRRKK